MKLYRVDQVIDGKVYEGGMFKRTRQAAERWADEREDADRETGEYRTSYVVTEIKV